MVSRNELTGWKGEGVSHTSQQEIPSSGKPYISVNTRNWETSIIAPETQGQNMPKVTQASKPRHRSRPVGSMAGTKMWEDAWKEAKNEGTREKELEEGGSGWLTWELSSWFKSEFYIHTITRFNNWCCCCGIKITINSYLTSNWFFTTQFETCPKKQIRWNHFTIIKNMQFKIHKKEHKRDGNHSGFCCSKVWDFLLGLWRWRVPKKTTWVHFVPEKGEGKGKNTYFQ